VPKRWRLPGGTVNGPASVTAAELADLGTAISLLRRENIVKVAEAKGCRLYGAIVQSSPRNNHCRAERIRPGRDCICGRI
jgi:hypothetical protein